MPNFTDYRVVALMRDENPRGLQRTYEVAELPSGALIVRGTAVGASGWRTVHMGLSPDLDTYLERCHGNFGWTVEKVENHGRTVACEVGKHSLCTGTGSNGIDSMRVRCGCSCHEAADNG